MRRRTYLGLVGAAGLAGCLGEESSPEKGGNPGDSAETNSENSDTGSAEGVAFEQAWRTTLGSITINGVNHDAALSDDGLFSGSEAGLVAFERADGADRWARERPAEYETVLADAGTVVALSKDGELLVVDADDGSIRWRDEVPGRSPRVALSEGLVCSGGEHGLIAHDRESGDQLWRVEETPSTVLAADDVVIASPQSEQATYAYDSDGQRRWKQSFSASAGGAISGDRYVTPTFGFDGDALTAVDLASGDTRWTVTDISLSAFVDIGAATGVAVVYEPSEIGAEDSETVLRAFTLADGEPRWDRSLGRVTVPFRPPAIDSDLVVAQTAAGIGAYDIDTGEQRAETTEPFLVMVGLLDDRRFFNCSRNIVAYDL